jgi:hypothetical protein
MTSVATALAVDLTADIVTKEDAPYLKSFGATS